MHLNAFWEMGFFWPVCFCCWNFFFLCQIFFFHWIVLTFHFLVTEIIIEKISIKILKMLHCCELLERQICQISIFCGHSLTQICSTFFCAENYFMIFYNYLPLHNFVIVHYMTFFFYVFQEAWWFVLIMKIDMNDFVAFHFIFSENSNGINLMNKLILKLL